MRRLLDSYESENESSCDCQPGLECAECRDDRRYHEHKDMTDEERWMRRYRGGA